MPVNRTGPSRRLVHGIGAPLSRTEPLQIVVAGAGHASMLALDTLGAPPPGSAVTLVSRGEAAHYSGMVPGWIEGLYRPDELVVPLAPFTAARGITLVAAEIAGADGTRLHLADGRDLPYDVLVVNAGSETARPGPLAHPAVIPAKPFGELVDGLAPRLDTAGSFAVVGAGAAGAEIALALATRRPRAAVTLIDRSPALLPAHPPAFAGRVGRALGRRGVTVRLGTEVMDVADGRIALRDGTVAADTILAVTGPAPPRWLAVTPFARTPDGFLGVDAQMRSLSHPNVLAVGDVATRPDDPRPKAGVFSVRSGPALAAALRALAAGEPLEPVRLQRRALILLATGDRSAIGTRNGLVAEGRWVWRLKDHLDRQFMARLTRLPNP